MIVRAPSPSIVIYCVNTRGACGQVVCLSHPYARKEVAAALSLRTSDHARAKSHRDGPPVQLNQIPITIAPCAVSPDGVKVRCNAPHLKIKEIVTVGKTRY